MAAENKVKWVIIIETPLTHDTSDHYVYLKRKRIWNVSVKRIGLNGNSHRPNEILDHKCYTKHRGKTQLAPELLR